ncbi:hypothetical protein HZF08_37725 [Paenibacillus sp. CGMCC 1.16610]|uniref:Uncharacterized protein n=1 Tax=Paenibacillus anseongense TaxID=2682845 RepID=A0ABW9UF34_9BACL|nr:MULTISPECIES: hypothetical protein [Paenibacillus]MBA2944015.1 hypothetical protein [Paenibacillus sp. CGMCC 1.16610]MVQ37904.1 hypothetical protein [Paenibacillus anseongense]
MSVQLKVKQSPSTVGIFKHAVTMVMGMWLIVGLFIDGFAHNHGAVETFFTPWHAILYSGYLACAIWILIITYQNKIKAHHATWAASIPTGYRLGVAGVIIFFVGGIGDMLWHTIFGIEKNIEALLSPTHLILLTGALMILTSPYRAMSVAEKDVSPSFRRLLPALTSVALTFAVMAFFLMYAWSFRQNLWMAREEDAVAKAVVDFLVTTMLLVLPIMLVMRRWKLPFGTVTYFFVFEAVLMAVLDGFSHYGSIVILLISGIIGDLLLKSIKEKKAGAWQYRGVFFLLPVLIWSLYFTDLRLFHTLDWSPELWGGTIFICGLCSMGLSMLTAPLTTGRNQ